MYKIFDLTTKLEITLIQSTNKQNDDVNQQISYESYFFFYIITSIIERLKGKIKMTKRKYRGYIVINMSEIQL